jgi:predicted MFS family arabinose efflux permease
MFNPAPPWYRWYVAGLLTVIAALNYGDRSAISSVLPLIRADLGMSDVALGALGSAFLWTYAACSPFSGFMADRLPRSRVIVWSLTAWSLVTFCTGWVRSPGEMIAARVLLGIAECAFTPAAIALVAQYHTGSTRARAIGLQLAGYNLGVVLGGGVAGYAGDHWGWRPAFFALGAAGLVMAVVSGFTLPKGAAPDVPRAARQEPVKLLESMRGIFAVPTYRIVFLESSCVAAGVWMFLVWLPLYFRESFNLSLTAAGFAGTAGLQVAATTASLLGGYASDRFAGRARERRMLFQFLCFTSSIPFLAVFAGNPSFEMVSVAILLFAFFRSLGSTNDTVILCDVLPGRFWSTGVGVANASNCVAGGIGVLLTGYLKADFGLGGVFAAQSVTVTAAAILVFWGYRKFLRKDLDHAQSALTASALENT